MLEKLNEVRAKPEEKGNVGKTILDFVVVLLLGVLMLFAGALIYSVSSTITQNANATAILVTADSSGLFIGIDLFILFMIAYFSRTPLLSTFKTITFIGAYMLSLYVSYLLSGTQVAEGSRNSVIFRMVALSVILVIFAVLNYFLWYSRGEGKLADVLSDVEVAAIIALIALPVYQIAATLRVHGLLRSDISLIAEESISIVVSAISLALFIFFAIFLGIKLRKNAEERKELFQISISCGIVFAILIFILIAKTSPIATDTYLF